MLIRIILAIFLFTTTVYARDVSTQEEFIKAWQDYTETATEFFSISSNNLNLPSFAKVFVQAGSNISEISMLQYPNKIEFTVRYTSEYLILKSDQYEWLSLTPQERLIKRHIILTLNSLDIEGKNDREKALILHDYVIKAVTYKNKGKDDDHTAWSLLSYGTGVCDGYAKLYQLLLHFAGIEALLVTGDAGGPHAWNLARLNGAWCHIDTTWDDPLPDTGKVRYAYFCLSDKEISKSHSWERGKYPMAR